jgi:hypothetical protein
MPIASGALPGIGFSFGMSFLMVIALSSLPHGVWLNTFSPFLPLQMNAVVSADAFVMSASAKQIAHKLRFI